MSRKKLVRFEEIKKMGNVIEPTSDALGQIKGGWSKKVFKNENSITLELGCGKGEYTVGLARLFPKRNFVGIDIKGERIWKGAGKALEEGLSNVRFLRTQVELLRNHFEEGEVNEIWLTFPDPRSKKSDERRRLTSPRFLKIYKNILCPGGFVHLKTDNRQLLEYTLNLVTTLRDAEHWKITGLEWTTDLYNSKFLDEHHGLQTNFETRYLEKGLKIGYLRFSFDRILKSTL